MEVQSNEIVSVIVVSLGRTRTVFSCLESLKQQTYPRLQVILIDNSLTSEFSQAIAKQYPGVAIDSSPRNLYYCEALNRGIAASRGAFILCLNDDVVLDRDFIEKALSAFFIDERIGIVSGKILRADRATIDSTGLFLTPWRTAWERGYGWPDRGQYQRPGYIFGVNGAVAFYRKSMLDDIRQGTYLDNDFHIFFEDLDIAWRAHKTGWQGYYTPAAIALHDRGATVRTPQGANKPGARRFLNDQLHGDLIKNRYLAMIKNESLLSFVLHSPFIMLYDLILWSYIALFRPKQIRISAVNFAYVRSAWKKRILRR